MTEPLCFGLKSGHVHAMRTLIGTELISPAEMAEVDRQAIAEGPLDGMDLMRNAGRAVASLVLARYPMASRVHVLCGPGNNGGDGYVVARVLTESGVSISLWASAAPKPGSDAATAAAECPLLVRPLADFDATQGDVVVDAIYGAGLSKPLEAAAARAVERATSLGLTVVAVDLPSGVSGESGKVLGSAFRADVTVSFARKKPGHLLLPGREYCGEVVLADIGISDKVIKARGIRAFENTPGLWLDSFPAPAVDTHKYKRGHVGVFSGGPASTGAARLSAMAAARAGAGAVTVLSPSESLAANAAHLTSVMLRKADSWKETQAFFEARRPEALVFGPGLGPERKVGDFALQLIELREDAPRAIVLDADAITSLALQPDTLFKAAHMESAPSLVITPHEGEFGRLFREIAERDDLSKLAKARAAAELANAVIIYKGADTVIAAPDGMAAINANGSPWLATAGSGDVLSGVVAGLLAQRMPPFDAACAAVWVHAEAGTRFGPGLIAEDLPLALVPVLKELIATPIS